MISLPPAFSIKVSCDHSAGTIASSAPASMKVAPETGLEIADLGGVLADHEAGAAKHAHVFLRMKIKKAPMAPWFRISRAGPLGSRSSVMDVTNHGAMKGGRDGDAIEWVRYEVPCRQY
jgi:hypothetical protein